MKRHSLNRPWAAVLAFALVFCQATWVLAGTTGRLSGLVTDDGGAPVAGADIKAVSASQSAETTTDGAGHFAFLSLAPDTYTVSIDKSGFNPVSFAGVTIFADQQQTLSFRLQKALKEIAKVSARSAGALVKAGTTSDVYSVNASTAGKLTGLGGGGGLDNAYSAIASVPGAFVPVGQAGWYQNVYIRGGDYDQVGYEVDGVPVNRSFDNYPSSTASALGQQEVQVYTGANPANSESQGLSGFINQVIKTGSYPGFATSDLGVGAPAYYHKANVEVGGATPDRLFSYYAGFGGYNQDFRYIDNNNGVGLNSVWGVPVDWATPNSPTFVAGLAGGTTGPGACGAVVDINNDICYASSGGLYPSNGPGGFILGSFNYASLSSLIDRESVVNFHFGIPHKKDGGRDDLQLLYQSSDLLTQYYNATPDVSASAIALSNTGGLGGLGISDSLTTPTFVSGFSYSGPVGQPLLTVPAGAGKVSVAPGAVAPYGYPSQPAALGVGGIIPNNLRDQADNGIGIVKLQYQKNFGATAYLRVYGYTLYSNWFLYGPNTTWSNFVGPNPQDYELSSRTRGVSATLAKQLNPRNLINLQLSYITATVIRDNNTQATNGGQTLGVLVSATNPNSGVCYNNSAGGGAAAPTACSGSIGGTPTTFSQARGFSGGTRNDPALNTCSGGPCEFLAVNGGPNATYNNVKPNFAAASLTDEWDPSDRLHLNLGVRWDQYQFSPASTAGPARDFYFNAWNQAMCVDPADGVFRPVPKTNVQLPCNDPANNAGYAIAPSAGSYSAATLTNTGQTQTFNVFQPRVGVTFTVNPQNVLRFSYGKYDQAPNSAFEQYNTLQQDLASFIGLRMYQYGRTQSTYPIRPELSYNTDLSWEHQFRGTDMSFKLTPFYRKTQNQIQQFFLDPKTNFVSGLNVGSQTSDGVEFQFQKGDFSRDGFAALLSYTYTYAAVKYASLANGNSILTPINQQIGNYNSYTSFCASNPSNGLCGGAATVAAHAAPCYSGGVPITNPALCTGATVANPYWNAPAQGFLDIGASYAPYDIFPGAIGVGSYHSFVAPSVATIVLNYKHGPLAVTPAFQFNSGRKYGYPLSSVGIDPLTCGAPLGLAPDTARYPYGAAGGSAYDATNCGATISIPNPDTRRFDGIGAFVGPSRWTMNMQISYDFNKRVTGVVTLANIFDRCSGGTGAAWTSIVGANSNKVCDYGYGIAGAGGEINPVGNVYNPGAVVQPQFAHAYGPIFGSVPFNAYFDLKIKL